MSGRIVSLLAATSLLVGAPVEAQVEHHPDQGEARQGQGMMEMCRTMMGGMHQMMSMHGASPMEGGMGSGMMGMPGPGVILAARDVLGLTEGQIEALEDLAQEIGDDHMGNTDGAMAAHMDASAAASEVLDDEQRGRLLIGMQFMHGMMGQMMGQMGEGRGSDASDPADGHASHHR